MVTLVGKSARFMTAIGYLSLILFVIFVIPVTKLVIKGIKYDELQDQIDTLNNSLENVVESVEIATDAIKKNQDDIAELTSAYNDSADVINELVDICNDEIADDGDEDDNEDDGDKNDVTIQTVIDTVNELVEQCNGYDKKFDNLSSDVEVLGNKVDKLKRKLKDYVTFDKLYELCENDADSEDIMKAKADA
jgi:chromosome segregation ATPase